MITTRKVEVEDREAVSSFQKNIRVEGQQRADHVMHVNVFFSRVKCCLHLRGILKMDDG